MAIPRHKVVPPRIYVVILDSRSQMNSQSRRSKGVLKHRKNQNCTAIAIGCVMVLVMGPVVGAVMFHIFWYPVAKSLRLRGWSVAQTPTSRPWRERLTDRATGASAWQESSGDDNGTHKDKGKDRNRGKYKDLGRQKQVHLIQWPNTKMSKVK